VNWGGFWAVTTNAKTYVIDDGGNTQLAVAHPGTGRATTVAVYRTPWAVTPVTYIWYASHRPDGGADNHVLEYRLGDTAGPAEYRFSARAYDPIAGTSNPAATATEQVTISFSAWLAFIPATAFYWVAAGVTPEWRAVAARNGSIALVIALLSIGFTIILGRRRALTSRARIGWSALAFVVGPIAPLVLWTFVEPPPSRSRTEVYRGG
jgi:hypothetical protein